MASQVEATKAGLDSLARAHQVRRPASTCSHKCCGPVRAPSPSRLASRFYHPTEHGSLALPSAPPSRPQALVGMRANFADIARLCAECQSLIGCHDKIAVLSEVHYNLRKTLQVGKVATGLEGHPNRHPRRRRTDNPAPIGGPSNRWPSSHTGPWTQPWSSPVMTLE